MKDPMTWPRAAVAVWVVIAPFHAMRFIVFGE